MLCGMGTKNIPVLQRPKVHWVLIKSLIELEVTSKEREALRTDNKQSKSPFSDKRKIHLSELMLEKCPFPPGSDLAQKRHLIKQHTAPVSPQSTFFDTLDPSLASTEDKEDKFREKVDRPPNAQIHTFEATAQVNSLYKLGPKLVPGMNEISGDNSAIPQANCNSEEDTTTLCLQSYRQKRCQADMETAMPMLADRELGKSITGNPCYWGVMDLYKQKPFLKRNLRHVFAQGLCGRVLFSVSFPCYSRI
ncbi:hypothetical protein HPG69_002367, partial [Diceros bicornis minor]